METGALRRSCEIPPQFAMSIRSHADTTD
jgi:hypothetical protein